MKGVAVLALVVLGLVLTTVPAAADCDMAGPIDVELAGAPIAFVGEVVSVNGTAATFAVDEVWKGAGLGPVVEVRGAFDDGRFGEDDRVFEAGTRYLVLPYVDGNALRDTLCSATVEWTDDLAELRPSDARVSGDGGDPATGSSRMLLLAGIGLVVAIFAGISWMAFGRSRR